MQKIAVFIALIFSACCWFFVTSELKSIPMEAETQSVGDTVWVLSNGVHTDLLIPTRDPRHDFTNQIDSKDARLANYFAVGWGDRGFFIDTPRWNDLKAKVAFRALFLDSPGAMHVTYYQQVPENSAWCCPIVLSEEGYSSLLYQLRNGFLEKDGRFVEIPGACYSGRANAFFESTQSYNAVVTCNEWTRNTLQQAGVKLPDWTPFEWQLKRALHCATD